MRKHQSVLVLSSQIYKTVRRVYARCVDNDRRRVHENSLAAVHTR